MFDDSYCVSHVEKIDEQPWLYVLYEVNKIDWFLLIPYSPVSYVDTEMCIKLTDQEKNAVKKDMAWLKNFSEKVRFSPDKYLGRAVPKELQKKIDKF